MKTTKQMASEKAAYWSLNANCGITLYQAMVNVIESDGNGSEFYVPEPFKPGQYSHFLTKFSGVRVWLLRLGDYNNTKIMQAESDGTITIYEPTNEDDAKLQNMWLQQVGVPWRLMQNNLKDGWHLGDADNVLVKTFDKAPIPKIKVYAVRGEPTETVEVDHYCYMCSGLMTEGDHDPVLYKAGLWGYYNVGAVTAPVHHYCALNEWTLDDAKAPIL